MFRRIPWQDVCKFLAGAFFVNAGLLFYLYLARVSMPLFGTNFIETPEISGMHSIVHARAVCWGFNLSEKQQSYCFHRTDFNRKFQFGSTRNRIESGPLTKFLPAIRRCALQQVHAAQ